MSCDFNAVWGTTMHAGCLNILGNLTGQYAPRNGILKNFDASITTCAEAMAILGKRLEKRLAGSDVVVMSNGDTQFDISLRIGQQQASVIVSPNNSCNYPLAANYTKGADSGTANFGDLTQLLNWLVIRLRR